MNLSNVVKEQEPIVIEMRRYFHAHPELSGKEWATSEAICRYLDRWGIGYRRNVGGHGVVALIEGGAEGKTVGIRADMDALPIQEAIVCPFASQTVGVMHACGHDAHIAILLGTAKVLQSIASSLKGNIKCFFQPAEEGDGGALPMIRDGCLENPDVDCVIGLHVSPTVPTGKMELRYGKLNGNSGSIRIKVCGEAGHAAYPDTAVDAVVVAAQIIVALQTLVSRNTSPLDSVVLSLGTIHGGEKENIIANEVVICGTLRTLDTSARIRAKEFIMRIAENTAAAFGASAEVTFVDGYIALINDDQILRILEDVAAGMICKGNILYKKFPSLGVEDFAYFCDAVPSAFIHLGCGDAAKGCKYPLHSDRFQLDEGCLALGVEWEVRSALRLLGMYESDVCF